MKNDGSSDAKCNDVCSYCSRAVELSMGNCHRTPTCSALLQQKQCLHAIVRPKVVVQRLSFTLNVVPCQVAPRQLEYCAEKERLIVPLSINSTVLPKNSSGEWRRTFD
eukprot:6010664-Amphidinium_carterae.1